MEDPWSSGTTWAEPTKPVDQVSSPISTSPIRSPPPPHLDAGDPWGAQTPAGEPERQHSPSFDWQPSPVRKEVGNDAIQTPGWGGGWSEEAEAGPSRSPPRQPTESPAWGASERSQDDNEEAQASSIALPPTDDFTLTARPSLDLDSPSLATRGFADDPIPVSPTPLPAELDASEHISPNSPSFGDEFGGFASIGDDDPWGPKRPDAAWGESSTRDFENSGDEMEQESDDAEDTGDGWGGAHSRNIDREETPRPSGMDQEWEEAQKRIRVTEARAPREKIVKLQGEWRELIDEVIGGNKLPELADGEEEGSAQRLRKQGDDTYEVLRSLSMIPPDTNTYPPVLSSMETHERYQYALSRPTPTPETSLLTVAASRRSRRNDSMQDSLESWTSRSRLGEPEAQPIETTQQAEEAKPKWSFWRKNPAEKPLVTSGGGILEVKSLASPPIPAPLEPRPSGGSVISASGSKGSRPASPAPLATPALDTPTDLPATVSSPDPVAPAQSAVTRFFGRLSRRPTAQQTSEGEEKDMQLSADDFSFLDQVPVISSPANDGRVGDLLAFGGGRTEEISSLESMINSKSVPLPAPIAPPPNWSRSSSSAGPSAIQAKEVNLFDDLDFDTPQVPPHTASAMQPNLSQPGRTASSSSDWDDFLAPSQPSTVPSSAVPMMSVASPHRSHTPTITPNSSSPFTVPQQSTRDLASPIAGPSKMTPAHMNQQSADNDFDDFADFAPAPASKAHDFDDFGDFGDFSTPPPLPSQPNQFSTPVTSATSQLQAPPSTGHVKRASLDHSLTLNLMKDASAVKGQRWPAPPSPLAPQLEPPPKAPTAGASFPFLSPPPGSGRPSAGLGDLLDGGATGGMSSSASTPPRVAQQVPFTTSSPLIPGRTASPLSRPISAASNNASAPKLQPSQPAQSGLSAQDLSFFDSL